jgi:hypothetical protein
MKLNENGQKLWDIWDKKYCNENDRLGGNSKEGNYIEGWSIIDTWDFIHDITDECGLLIYGYDDDAIWTVAEWIDDGDTWDGSRINATYYDVIRELLQYFDTTPEEREKLKPYTEE